MTSAEAQNILTVPKFGDARCIAAVKHLEDVAAAREAMAKCRHKKCRWCGGTGRRRNDVCSSCAGAGTDPSCGCFDNLDSEAVLEARGK